jgi:hypothetical protein
MLDAAVLTTLWLLEAFELDVRRVGESGLVGSGSNMVFIKFFVPSRSSCGWAAKKRFWHAICRTKTLDSLLDRSVAASRSLHRYHSCCRRR